MAYPDDIDPKNADPEKVEREEKEWNPDEAETDDYLVEKGAGTDAPEAIEEELHTDTETTEELNKPE